MKVGPIIGAFCLTFAALGSLSCRREEKPAAPVARPPKPPLDPWTWHPVGGLLVVNGEVDENTELILKGRFIHERRFVEVGPVRWEMYRPPPGEVAELRNGEGVLLATWDFDQPPAAVHPPAAVPQKAEKKEQKPPEPKRPELKPTGPRKPDLKQPQPWKPEPKPPEPGKAESKKPEPRKPGLRMPETEKPGPKQPTTPEPKKPQPWKPDLRKPELHKPEPSIPEPKRTEPRKPKPPTPEPLKPEPSKPAPPPTPIPPGLADTWPGCGEGFNLLRGPRNGRQVCLTFDGGSNAEVALDVLNILKARGIHTTFFLTGAFIQKFPEIVRRIAGDGHEIGNHTVNHPHFAPTGRRDPMWTRERVQAELLEADRAFFRLLGRPMDPLWRAPYGEHTLEIRKWAEELGYRHVGWSEGADTLDWATRKERKLYRTGDAILDRLHDRMERQDGEGLIVLMHLGSERPVEDRPARVLGPFIDRALKGGWTFVRIGDYLRSSGKPAWDRDRRITQLR